jgi:hypothetical protein
LLLFKFLIYLFAIWHHYIFHELKENRSVDERREQKKILKTQKRKEKKRKEAYGG